MLAAESIQNCSCDRMPDWTYQTVFRPVLRRLSFEAAQKIALRTLGLLGQFAVGRAIVRFMGHGAPPAELATEIAGTKIASPVGLGCGVDPSASATSAFSLFGFGLIEVGPVSLDAGPGSTTTHAPPEWSESGLNFPRQLPALSVEQLRSVLSANVSHDVRLIIRLDERLVAQLADDQNAALLTELVAASNVLGVVLPPPTANASQQLQELFARSSTALQQVGLFVFQRIEPAAISGWLKHGAFAASHGDGIVLDLNHYKHEADASAGLETADSPDDVVALVRRLKVEQPELPLLTSGGVLEPVDAIDLLNAGADAVLVTDGLAVAGPGLPKRINDAIVSLQRRAIPDEAPSLPLGQLSWFWSFLMGLSLTVGGVLALVIGWTRVVLPYDEDFLNLQRDEICSLNERLLPFMSHDRVTLAGTMLALGPLYLALAWFGDRRGQHWARIAVIASALIGFLCFFSFLGFGYFDPFHAFVSSVLFQLMALGLHSSLGHPTAEVPDLRNTNAWRRALWGQLLMVMLGCAILLGGITICTFGMTTVFVQQDLQFLQASREAITGLNPKLVPLVAHDRATFGGMLMATGVTVALSALWGWRKGRRWLWWTLLLSGSTAFLTTIVIHWWVGYTSLIHLLPAYGGLAVLWLAMACSREWLCDQGG